ncbi:unnamed protein product [Porites lobata]|uniref:Uncharacterized protein n=1 Tax=Porites lobata TaxID=104759 RepID=A0ABN8RF94_9CNID|nr:unnamed protein product [Porites lobata]
MMWKEWPPQADVTILASCSYVDTIKLYKEDEDDWSCFDTLEGHESTVWAISFDKTGDRMGVPTHGSDPKWKTVCVLSGYHDRTVYDVHWSFVTDAIVTSSGDDCIRIFQQDPSVGDKNQPTFHQVAVQRKAHSQDVNGVKWHPKESGLLASCSDNGTINMWRFIPQD